MRFLIDEDMFTCLKFLLDAWGHDADAVCLNRNLVASPDHLILHWAADEQRVVITFNTGDYETLHEQHRMQSRNHAGIIVCRKLDGYRNFHLIVRWMENLLDSVQPHEFSNSIHYLHSFA